MIYLAQVDVGSSVTTALENVLAFLPKLVGFLLILVIGWFVSKAIAKAVDAVLERVGFDRAVERGGIRKAMANTRYDASDIVGKIVFYTLFLFTLQLAFGVFGDNPISELLFGVIAFLPKLFVALLIVVIAAAIAAAVREMTLAAIGGLSYGPMLAKVAAGAVLVIGVFAALNQVEIAPEIVNGLFYALLAIIAGSAIVAIGGGGIQPMRAKWEQALSRVEDEAPRVREAARGSSDEPADRIQPTHRGDITASERPEGGRRAP